ncbi:MAG: VOC family protein [Candidatus Hydrogenedentes bacterium]|nr:VOC family protein [Candidatus Hydrogenedentota bacterium]
MLIQPYVFFDGRCDEAIAFYTAALGAKVEMLLRFKDGPTPSDPNTIKPEMAEKVMHSSLRIGDSIILASDGQCIGKPEFEGFSLSLEVPDKAEADRVFNALADGGQVQMPLGETFFSPQFGMVKDRFGVVWMVIVPK